MSNLPDPEAPRTPAPTDGEIVLDFEPDDETPAERRRREDAEEEAEVEQRVFELQYERPNLSLDAAIDLALAQLREEAAR